MDNLRRQGLTSSAYLSIASEKQFKTKFPGQKNIRSDEWQAIVPTLKKRAHEGKESDLYLNGKLVNAKKVKREVARRHMAVPPAEAPMFENGERSDEVVETMADSCAN